MDDVAAGGLRLCVYTALTGQYEALNEQPMARRSSVPFICVTDDPTLRSQTWQVRPVAPLLPSDPARSQRALKLRPDLHLPEFDVSLYIDNSVLLSEPPEALFALRDPACPMAAIPHSFRASLREEFDVVLAEALDDATRIEEQRRHYETECPALLDVRPMWSGMILRDHRDPRLREAGAIWLSQVLRYSRRDQLSGPIALHRAHLAPQLLMLDNHASPYHSWPHPTARRVAMRHFDPATPAPAAPVREPLPIPAAPAPAGRVGRIVAPLRALARRTWWRVSAPIGLAAGRLDRREHVLDTVPGRDPALGPRVAVLVHHDQGGRIAPTLRLMATAFTRAGFSLVLASNAGRLAEGDLAWAREHAALTVLRRNRGLDFSAWKDAMRQAGLPRAETECLLLMNDSLYGPLSDIAPMLARLDFDTADIWGATDSWQTRWHLQSYFLAIGQRAMNHPAFAEFWAGVVPARSKAAVVNAFELGFSAAMLEGGLRCAALWPYARLTGALARNDASLLAFDPRLSPGHRARLAEGRAQALGLALSHRPLNPTAELWLALLEDGFPFIKRELLSRNPAAVPGVAAWRLAVERIAPGAAEAIELDLRMRMRGRSP